MSNPIETSAPDDFLPTDRLAFRLGLVLGGAVILTTLLAGVLLWRSRVEQRAYEALLTHEVTEAAGARTAQVLFKKQVQEWKNVLLRGGDSALRVKHLGAFRANERGVDSAARALLGVVTDTVARSTLTRFKVAHDSLHRGYDAALSVFAAGGYQRPLDADKMVRGVDRPPTDLLDGVVDRLELRVREESAALALRQGAERRYAVLAALLAVVLLGLGLWRFADHLARRVIRLEYAATRMAGGDLSGAVRPDGTDEIGRLGDAFATMAEQLRGTLYQVRMESGEVAAASRELAASTEQLGANGMAVSDAASAIAQASSQQTGALTLARDTASAVAATVEDQVEGTLRADAASAQVLRAATEAASAADAARSALEAIMEASAGAIPAAAELREHAEGIEALTLVVDGIARQTQLLSLNAAIEAARAGEQGRGFAVVAAEVRGLADRTGKALEQIRELTTAVRRVATGNAERLVEIRQRVHSGEETIGTALLALHSISRHAGDARAAVARVAEAGDPYRAAVEDLLRQIGQVSHAAERNAATAEALSASVQEQAASLTQSASASRSLRDVAARLDRHVGVFTLDEGDA
jgi:methyl-accepting chemotaxis protein